MDSLVSWHDDGTEVEVVESNGVLAVSTTTDGQKRLLVTYERGHIRSIVDRHSVTTCTLKVTADDGERHTFTCPAEVCAVLVVKLRKFQGAAETSEVA